MTTTTLQGVVRKESFPAAFWEGLWRSAGLQSAGLFAVAAFLFGLQPAIGASAESVANFYDGERLQILAAASVAGLATLNLMWFSAAVRTEIETNARGGWGGAVTASAGAAGALLLLFAATIALLAYAAADLGAAGLMKAGNDFAWTTLVLSSFPRAMVIMSCSFGLWRSKVISNGLFTLCVFALLAVLAGGTTWARDGVWAPDGIYSREISPAITLVWLVIASALLLRRAPTAKTW